MTQNPQSSRDSIARRTALSILGGGLVTLAGCNSTSSGGTNSPTSTSTQPSTDGWVPPEQQSEYIIDSSFVADELDLYLELELQNSSDIADIRLLDALKNEYSNDSPTRGKARLPIAEGTQKTVYRDEPPETNSITPGQNTLEIELLGDENPAPIPLRLETTVEFQQVSQGESVDGVDKDTDLAIVLENTGPHPTSPGIVQYANAPPEIGSDQPQSGKTVASEFTVIEPGETGTAVVPSDIWRTLTPDGTERTLEFTVSLFWANNQTVTQPVRYPKQEEGTSGSLAGSATVSSSQSTEAGNQ